MEQEPLLKIGEVARLTKISTRTLRYYEEIGLVTPQRSENGYRHYSRADFLRLQQVLIGRAFGLPLEEIKRSLDDPAFDLSTSLRRQRRALLVRVEESRQMISAIDAALAETEVPLKGGAAMDTSHLFTGFDPRTFEQETRERWGDTTAYKENVRRTSRYSEQDWKQLTAELDAIWDDGAAAMRDEVTPASERAQELVERHRLHIDRWHYPLSPQMHVKLGEMWELDERFRETIDNHGEGLTLWFAAAIRARIAANS